MAQPYNYMLDIPNPVETVNQSIANGFNIAAKVDQAQQQREQLALQKQQREQMQKDFSNVIQNPTYENFSNLKLKYPQQHEAIESAFKTMNSGEQETVKSISSQVFAALDSDKPEIAKDMVSNLITGYENAGNTRSANVAKGYLKMLNDNPDAAKISFGRLWQIADDGSFKTYNEQKRANEIQPYEIAESEAKTAKTIAETGDIAENAIDRRDGVLNDQRKTELQNQQYYDNLGQANRHFYDSLTQKEKAEAERLRAVKNETAAQRTERLEKVNTFSSVASDAATTATLAAELINDYKKLSDASGAGVWNAAMRNVPGTAEYDFAKRVETLKSKAFLIGAQNLKGLGAMTEIEGKKATDAIGNLDLSQSTDQVAKQLAAIARSANSVAQTANRNAQNYATKGQGYSKDIREAAKKLGISEAHVQKFVNENGL
ncbi:hypothetical protein [Acinetobacter ursingii]|uniref:hypothetical protein n=1 Tax=Acinetobacter ursingii TaxID=108980 RepID=UPI0032B3139C